MRAVVLAAETPLPPAAIGLLAFGALLVLLVMTYAFRHAGNRHTGQRGTGEGD